MSQKSKTTIIETITISLVYFIVMMSFFLFALFFKEYYIVYLIIVTVIVSIGTAIYLRYRIHIN